jgi:dipeptidyl aminopeptidase/acylaminoacyl peptidase
MYGKRKWAPCTLEDSMNERTEGEGFVSPARGRSVSALLVAALLSAALPGMATAQNRVASGDPADDSNRLSVSTILDWENVGDAQISPDGTEIVYTRSWVDQLEDDWQSALWIMNADGSRQRFLAKGSSPRWSPDGTRIAYLAEVEESGTQIFVRWMDAEGAVSQVTRTQQSPLSLRWSPDGTRIAFTMFVPDESKWKIDMPAAPEGATWTSPPREINRVHFRRDRRGFLETGAAHLFVVPATGGTARQLTHGEGTVGQLFAGVAADASLSWTPDGLTIVVEGLLEKDWEERYRESHIYAVDVGSGAIRQITREKGPWSGPRLSPDGQLIAFTGYPWSRQTYRAADLYVIGLDGSNMRTISGDLDRSPQSLRWARDGSGVFFTVPDRGTSNVHFASLDGAVRPITDGTHMLTLNSISAGGLAAGVLRSATEPGDVVAYSLSNFSGFQRLTAVNDDVLAGLELGDVEEVWYESSGDARIQGWVVKPPNFDPDRRYPLILHIHGGPHAMYNVGFNLFFQTLAANDYVVLYTNPRGSTGYGTDFGNAIDNGYPSVDYDDLMAGVDAVIDLGYADSENMFVTGCSGGGVLSSWVIGKTDRFAAAGVRCPVVNWMSFAGTADIVRWGYERYEGYPWTNPDAYLAHSPLMLAGNVTTPTVVMTGELDLRTPMSQSEEYYQALRAEGVPTVLLRFNEEYHGTTSKPSNFMRTALYLMSWFEKWGTFDDEEEKVAGTNR